MKAVDAPIKAITHIQNTAPGPPIAMAVATPTMLPVPTLPERARQKAWKEDTPLLSPLLLNSSRIIRGTFRTWTKRVRTEK